MKLKKKNSESASYILFSAVEVSLFKKESYGFDMKIKKFLV